MCIHPSTASSTHPLCLQQLIEDFSGRPDNLVKRVTLFKGMEKSPAEKIYSLTKRFLKFAYHWLTIQWALIVCRLLWRICHRSNSKTNLQAGNAAAINQRPIATMVWILMPSSCTVANSADMQQWLTLFSFYFILLCFRRRHLPAMLDSRLMRTFINAHSPTIWSQLSITKLVCSAVLRSSLASLPAISFFGIISRQPSFKLIYNFILVCFPSRH